MYIKNLMNHKTSYFLPKLLLLFFIPAMGCNAHSRNITGFYKIREHNFMVTQFLYLFKTTYPKNSSLEIKPDSTYYIQNCGNVENGTWKVHGDTLFLFCKIINGVLIPSIKQATWEGLFLNCGTGPETYIIDGNTLKNKVHTNDGLTVLLYFDKVVRP